MAVETLPKKILDKLSEILANIGVTVFPIGVVIPWLKSFANTPSLPSIFVECNGQTLNDNESVYDGQVIPNLNGGNRFLRGSSTSGGTGGSSTVNLNHDHSQPSHTHFVSDSGNTGNESSHTHSFSDTSGGPSSASTGFDVGIEAQAASLIHTHNVSGTTGSGSSHRHSFSMSDTSSSAGDDDTGVNLSSSTENKPPYYNIVWIMRIK